MSTLVVLDYCVCNVLFIKIDDETARKMQDEYDGDSEAWIAGEGLEKKYGFRMSDSN